MLAAAVPVHVAGERGGPTVQRLPPGGGRVFRPDGGRCVFRPGGGRCVFRPDGGRCVFRPGGGRCVFRPGGGRCVFRPDGCGVERGRRVVAGVTGGERASQLGHRCGGEQRQVGGEHCDCRRTGVEQRQPGCRSGHRTAPGRLFPGCPDSRGQRAGRADHDPLVRVGHRVQHPVQHRPAAYCPGRLVHPAHPPGRATREQDRRVPRHRLTVAKPRPPVRLGPAPSVVGGFPTLIDCFPPKWWHPGPSDTATSPNWRRSSGLGPAWAGRAGRGGRGG